MTNESWKEKVVEPTPPATAGWVPPTTAELAPLFPELEIVALLGRGGMGAVYKVKQRRLERWAALKILPAEVGRDPAFAERFAREARVLAGLSHPNIVTVHDFGETGGRCWFLMEFVDGLNLRQMLAAGKIAPREALAVVPQICDALQFAHEQGIVHRDIKPENILLDKFGRVKITDFGLAKLMDRGAADVTLTATGQTLGSPPYMAPEQIERPQEVDHRADIYSLGVVFYQMLTGELPLGRFAPPSRKVQVDVRLDEIVLRTLEKEPELRYQHARDVRTQVETLAGTSGLPAPSRPSDQVPAPVGQGGRVARIGAVLVAAAPLLLGVFVLFMSRRFEEAVKDSGAARAAELASGMRVALPLAAVAVGFGVAGLTVLGLALFKYRYRAQWFFWVLLSAAVLMLFAFPVGTVLGVLLLIYVGQRRAEFFGEQSRFPAAGQAPATTVPASGTAIPPTPLKSRWWIWLLVGLLLLIALPVVILWLLLVTLG